jgi:hypothetical protein
VHPRLARILVIAPLVVVVEGAGAPMQGASLTVPPPPLIGTNYTHYALNGKCSTASPDAVLNGTGIVANYTRPGVAATVSRQLAVMRARGIQSLRLIVWHQTDPGPREWGVVSSAGGRLSDRDRTGLIGYLTSARKAGFVRLTVSFGPVWTNDPVLATYDPGKLDENWAFLRYLRALIKRFGPPSTHIDLMNEAPQSSADPAAARRIRSYLAEMYRRYVQAFGSDDVSVSATASQSPADTRARLDNLIGALRSTWLPLPRWFEVHISYQGNQALRGLQVADATLAAAGLAQPLVLSEVGYNEQPVAQAIAQFLRTSTRRVLEVIEWPLTADRPCTTISVPPPYTASAYITALRPRHVSMQKP